MGPLLSYIIRKKEKSEKNRISDAERLNLISDAERLNLISDS